MADLIHGRVGILPQGDNNSVKIAPGSLEVDHGRGGTGDSLTPPHGDGDNTPPKGVAPNRSERREQAIIHLTMVLGHQIQITVLSLPRRQMRFLLLMLANTRSK